MVYKRELFESYYLKHAKRKKYKRSQRKLVLSQ